MKTVQPPIRPPEGTIRVPDDPRAEVMLGREILSTQGAAAPKEQWVITEGGEELLVPPALSPLRCGIRRNGRLTGIGESRARKRAKKVLGLGGVFFAFFFALVTVTHVLIEGTPLTTHASEEWIQRATIVAAVGSWTLGLISVVAGAMSAVEQYRSPQRVVGLRRIRERDREWAVLAMASELGIGSKGRARR